jgi:preprotein translocase subunit SecG
MLSGLLTFLLVLVALILVLLIIVLQHGNEGGIGSAFGSGNSAGFFGASGGVSLIVRATWGFGFAFFVLAMSLAWVKTRVHYGVGLEINSLLGDESTSPGAAASPTAATPAGAASPAQKPSDAPAALPGAEQAPASPAP